MLKQIVTSISAAAVVSVLGACAGSPPDFTARTDDAPQRQVELAEFLAAGTSASISQKVIAPVCSSVSGNPSKGWGIDAGSWCVVSCGNSATAALDSGSGNLNQWVRTSAGQKCFVTDQGATSLVETQFQPDDWDLNDQPLFQGLDRSFFSDTEWACAEQEYQIDPGTHQGFWVDLQQPGNIYRFYNDGAIVQGRAGGPLNFLGNWQGGQEGVLLNDRRLFRHAVNYGGGRFDEFQSATRKQLCRFVDNVGPRTSL